MANLVNWKQARLIAILIAVVSAVFLLRISDSILGVSLSDTLMGFDYGIILGIAQLGLAYLMWTQF